MLHDEDMNKNEIGTRLFALNNAVAVTTDRAGFIRVDLEGELIASEKNVYVAANAAHNLLISERTDLNDAIYITILNLLKMGCNLITVDPCEVNTLPAVDIHASRHGIMVDAFTIDAFGECY